ncbi:MAG: 5-demethoxyubiquinol-8 5-hydroxylase UbiM [Cocleimonas sp.]|nr:5-demethoxyubiquinol-8 5-hydroxylase UbiM [Cocleimonas sp.]
MDYDVIIIGAGPAGLSFARSLAETKLRILLIEKSPLDSIEDPAEDGREIALTHLSVKLMKQLGAWGRIDSDSISPIKTAKVLNGDSAYSLDFTRPTESLEALGYLIPNHLIRKAFYDEVATFKNITLMTKCSVTDVNTNATSGRVTLSTDETLTASLVVSSDSRFSATRRKMGISTAMQDFSRTAIVCRMEHELSHQQTAFECFHYGKTMALLPMTGNLSSVVITISNQKVDRILNMTDEQFNHQVQQWFGNKLGKISLVGKRHSYPLIAVHADKFVSNRYAVVGDASVGMHPVTAHGFNLGLRGADTLAGEIKKAKARGKDIASMTVLNKYERKHMRITKILYHGTNHIVSLFTNETRPAKIIRSTALRIANNFPPIRHLITAKLTETGKADFLPSLPPLPFKNLLSRKTMQ